MFIRNWRVTGISQEDGGPTGWNRVSFEVSTLFVLILTILGMFLAVVIAEALNLWDLF